MYDGVRNNVRRCSLIYCKSVLGNRCWEIGNRKSVIGNEWRMKNRESRMPEIKNGAVVAAPFSLTVFFSITDYRFTKNRIFLFPITDSRFSILTHLNIHFPISFQVAFFPYSNIPVR